MPKVRLLFKSGTVQEFVCTKFTVTKSKVNNSIIRIEWEGLDPDILYIDISAIDAVLNLIPVDVKEI